MVEFDHGHAKTCHVTCKFCEDRRTLVLLIELTYNRALIEMAQKNISSHLSSVPGPSGSSSGRVKKQGKGNCLPTWVVEAVRTFC